MSGSTGGFNFVRDVVERLAIERPRDEALRTIAADGSVRSYTFADAPAASEAAAGSRRRASAAARRMP